MLADGGWSGMGDDLAWDTGTQLWVLKNCVKYDETLQELSTVQLDFGHTARAQLKTESLPPRSTAVQNSATETVGSILDSSSR